MKWINLIIACTLVGRVIHATATFPNPQPRGESWEECSIALDLMISQGNGTTFGSCMSCSPTYSVCPQKCQPLIEAYYIACDGTYSPPGVFFDPGQTIHGEWNTEKTAAQVRIAIERCGCNTASTPNVILFLAVSILFGFLRM